MGLTDSGDGTVAGRPGYFTPRDKEGYESPACCTFMPPEIPLAAPADGDGTARVDAFPRRVELKHSAE